MFRVAVDMVEGVEQGLSALSSRMFQGKNYMYNVADLCRHPTKLAHVYISLDLELSILPLSHHKPQAI